MSDDVNGDADAFDRLRRRVLWAMPTGLFLIGSRHGEEANLMTANLVVQVCQQPKLVGAAIEVGSVTAGLVQRGGAFSLSLLHRADKDVVRRFVKPVTDMERTAEGTIASMSGHAVAEQGGALRLPVLAAAAGYLVCPLRAQHELGSHTFFIGEVTDAGGEPAEVLRMEDTRMHYGG